MGEGAVDFGWPQSPSALSIVVAEEFDAQGLFGSNISESAGKKKFTVRAALTPDMVKAIYHVGN